MSTDIRDRFEDRLLNSILEHFDELAGDAPAAPAAPERARGGRRVTLRRSAVGLLAGAAVAALAATALTGLAGNAPDPARPAMRDAAYVVGHVQAALSQSSAIEFIRARGPNGHGSTFAEQTWTNGVSQHIVVSDSHGRPEFGYLETSSPSGTALIAVNYHARTWSRAFAHGIQVVFPPNRATHGSGPTPLRDVVARYHWTVLGEMTVDGQRAIHLRVKDTVVDPSGMAVMGNIDFTTDLWVNAATYLPVRQVISYPDGRVFRGDYQWLPITPATLRLLTSDATIPAGFVPVQAPPQFPNSSQLLGPPFS